MFCSAGAGGRPVVSGISSSPKVSRSSIAFTSASNAPRCCRSSRIASAWLSWITPPHSSKRTACCPRRPRHGPAASCRCRASTSNTPLGAVPPRRVQGPPTDVRVRVRPAACDSEIRTADVSSGSRAPVDLPRKLSLAIQLRPDGPTSTARPLTPGRFRSTAPAAWANRERQVSATCCRFTAESDRPQPV